MQSIAPLCGHPAADFVTACTDYKASPPSNQNQAVRFIEAHFQPVAVEGPGGNATGLFTGYYEPELRGSTSRQRQFQTPIYAKPSSGPPYLSRAEIDRGGLEGKAGVLAYVDDPVAAFFMQVQGSGRVRVEDGSLLPLAYAGNNGLPYTAIGKTLADDGSMRLTDINAGSIAAWLHAHPDRAQAVMERNVRYVFFKRAAMDRPVGASGRILVPGVSLAVDPAFVPLGSLLWLSLDPSAGHQTPSLMRADDKGAAIAGAVRGDLYLGSGADAAREAGMLKARGRYWILKPIP